MTTTTSPDPAQAQAQARTQTSTPLSSTAPAGPRRHAVTLPYGQHAPEVARHVAARWLALECDGTGRTEDVVLIVSELVTNVVRHARGRCVLTLTVRGALLDIAVADRSESLPERLSEPGEQGGFGLSLIRCLGGSLTVVPALGGKTVHVALDIEARGEGEDCGERVGG